MKRGALCAGVLLAAMAAPVNAEVVINNTYDYSFLTFVPCANGGDGELVLLEGPRHEQFRLNIGGNQVRSGMHVDMHEVTGVGLTTGDAYRATGGLNSQVMGSIQDGHDYNTTLVGNFLVIGPGPGNNFLVRETFHLRINPDGTVTSSTDHDLERCG